MGHTLFQAFKDNSTTACDVLPSDWRDKINTGLACAREALQLDQEVPSPAPQGGSRVGFLFEGQLSGAEPNAHDARRASAVRMETEYGAFVETLLSSANPGTSIEIAAITYFLPLYIAVHFVPVGASV